MCQHGFRYWYFLWSLPLPILANVKLYAESEFWLSMIKVVAIVAMIILVCICYLTAQSVQPLQSVICGHMGAFSHMVLKAYFICWPL